jgi:hypothetical protein
MSWLALRRYFTFSPAVLETFSFGRQPVSIRIPVLVKYTERPHITASIQRAIAR